MTGPHHEPVYVTGIGVIAPNGLGAQQYWDATLEGRSGIAPLTRFDASAYPAALAGQISGFEPKDHIPGRLLPQTDVSTRFALAAADWALTDAKVDAGSLVDYEMGVVTSNASGGFDFTHREFNKLWAQGPQLVSVYESFAWFYAVNTGQISIRHGMRGPSSALVADQAGGLDAIGHARRTARRGTRLVVAGGVDSAFDPWGWVSHLSSGGVSQVTDPARAYTPFDSAAAGWIPGEGGAILVLERAEAARARGESQIYGEIAGYASTFDPPPGSPRPPGLRRAAELALADAGVTPAEVDVVFADAAGLAGLDRAEAAAITGIFGPHGVPVTAPKALTGRLLSGGGPLDVVSALLSIRDGVLPATAGTEDVPGDYGLDLVLHEPRAARVATALILARGRWGFNSAVVVRAVRD
ncbi:actinorhodin polyketide putative beta-ketoacyl synthase 2 [Actinoplanes cyaneus]|uniref:Actinorhodin polyketide putative beta-ketoacyl synthase 2 n=1 Tax=Actinoplanes cyaneus TaxID=52696 RepID=A0A919IPM9_9ACTN|nr:ketosynthase chain-length factor [Actinoplanes cyaneus]MCW2139745.1 act minimal PKS chain-length factor (CLF/KS beta) [Actinoplanes cyaneus]GID69900.1 actinorhodin polyketide putative beta-ketoacyl synthase 2 [Actinoplanes cyaneus]